MFDHVSIAVRDYDRSKAFYVQALAPLGVMLVAEPEGVGAGFAEDEDGGSFWIGPGGPLEGRLHIAFSAKTREQVRAFHAAALAAGGADNGGPGLRPVYHADYYGAFVLDPDGHNVEAVCHLPE